MWIWTHPFVKRLKRVCLIITQRPLGPSPKGGNSVLLECHSALQKCQIGYWTPNTLSCSCAFWTPFLGFLEPVLTPRCVFTRILRFLSIFLDNSGFFKNSYLVDKYPKINLDKVHIIHNFIFIQLSLYSYACNPILNTNYQPITKLFN